MLVVYRPIVANSMSTIYTVFMKIDRLMSIIMILLDKKRIGAKELADMFEVSPRTIYRDIDSINMAGIPVHSISGVGGGFEIMESYKVEKGVFSSKELSSILMGLTSLSSMIRGDELVNALTKVKSFIPAEKVEDIELQINQIDIDLTPWMGNRNIQPYLEIIKEALQKSKLLSFHYADRRGKQTERKAEPYQLVLKNRHWYWRGYCHKRDDFRLFKLSRMSKLQLLEESFSPREYDKPELDGIECQNVTHTPVKIRIHRSIMDRALEYCTYDELIPDGDEHFIVHFPFFENDYYYNILLSLGNRCECLEPQHIRLEMRRRVEDMLAIYK